MMNDNMKTSIGKELKKIRIDKGLSVEDVRDFSGLNKDTIYKYERGQGNSMDTLQVLLNSYNVPFAIFFRRIYDTMQNNEEE